jgi:hypothetical protein
MILLAAACGKSEEQKQAETAAKQMGDAIAAGGAVAAGVMAGKASDAVDFRELKELLPEDLPGMKRTGAEGQKSGAMGFTMSTAEGRYAADDGPNIQITISDVGAMTGMGAMAAYAWAAAEIDSETETGYERTTKIKGYRGFEKYDRQNKFGEISLLVAGRFVVEVEGNDVSVDALKEALDKVDLGKLEGMKNVGVK